MMSNVLNILKELHALSKSFQELVSILQMTLDGVSLSGTLIAKSFGVLRLKVDPYFPGVGAKTTVESEKLSKIRILNEKNLNFDYSMICGRFIPFLQQNSMKSLGG